jgi:hypothetical protein
MIQIFARRSAYYAKHLAEAIIPGPTVHVHLEKAQGSKNAKAIGYINVVHSLRVARAQRHLRR